MGFKIKKKKSIFGFSEKKQKLKLMKQIAVMLDDREFAKALPLLREAVKKYPNEEHFWEMYGYVGSELHLTSVMQKAFARLAQFQPNDPDILHNLAVVYSLDMYPALAMRSFREFARRFSFDSRADEARRMAAVLEEEVTGLLKAYHLPVDEEGFKIAALHDKIQLYMHQGEYEKSIQTARELIKKAPEFIAPYNNLSLVYFMSGDVEKALETARLALEKQPENYHALGNTARFLAFLGKTDEARNYANRLRTVERDVPDIYDKKIETFAYLGDDESVADVYREIEKGNIALNEEGFIKNLAAFSFYQLGDEKKAEKLWEEAADDEYDEAEENLEELESPVYDRDVFALELNYWLPSAYMQELLKLAASVEEEEDLDETIKKKTGEFIDKNPHLISVLPMILERGSFSAKEFVIKLAQWSESPKLLEILKDFAFGQKGSDEIRNQAALALSILKAIPKSGRMWLKGKWADINFMGFNITVEPTYEKLYPIKPPAKELLAKGIEAIYANKNELAEELYRKALEIEPDHPVLLNNLLMARQKKGEKFDVKKETEELHRRFPDYLYAGVNLGMFELREGNIERAKELADKFQDREEWHIEEFKLWSRLQIEICLEQKLFDGAKSWLRQMRQTEANFEFDDFDEAEYNKLEKRIETAEVLDRLQGGFRNLFSRTKRKGKKKTTIKKGRDEKEK